MVKVDEDSGDGDGNNCIDLCKRRTCEFNHPSRRICQFGNACIRRDCWYNHSVGWCRFGIKCISVNCEYRHPKRGSPVHQTRNLYQTPPPTSPSPCSSVQITKTTSPKAYNEFRGRNRNISKSGSPPPGWERIVKIVSQECLKTVMGKCCTNLTALKGELGCRLEVDIEAGVLAAICPSSRAASTESKISFITESAIKSMKNQVVEEEYLGGTRVVLGAGYEVEEILFPHEFTTMYFGRLHPTVTKEYLLNSLHCCVEGEDRAGKGVVRTIELQENAAVKSAVVKFFSKTNAKLVFEKLKQVMYYGQPLQVVPIGLGPKGGVNQEENLRLKISWPTGTSTGRANIAFTSPEEANIFVDNVNLILPGSKVNRVHGDLVYSFADFMKRSKKKPLPPALNLGRQNGSGIRFDTEISQELQLRYDYKVTLVDVRLDFDEQEIYARLRPAIPKWVQVERVSDHQGERMTIQRAEKLAPIQDFLNESNTYTEFYDKNAHRAGIYVTFENKQTLENAYRSADYVGLGTLFGQFHRKEIEYTHSAAIHKKLYHYLEDDIADVMNFARKKGIHTSEFLRQRTASQFITIRFHSCNANLIRQVQEKLEEITNCVQFTSEKIDLLFSSVGRIKLLQLAEKHYIHWTHRTQAVLVYGKPDVQKKVLGCLQQIVDYLKTMDVIDKQVQLNKRKVNITENRTGEDVQAVQRICIQSLVQHFYFSGNNIFVSGSEEAVKTLEESLIKKGFLFVKTASKLGSRSVTDCGICLCPREPGFIRTTVCGHSFCISCIEPMFKVEPVQFPIKCPECQVPLVIGDIIKCAPQRTLKRFLEHAVFKYQEQHEDEVVVCPKQGCNQLLLIESRRAGEQGGEFIFCDECVTTYCIACSKKLDKPVKSHDYDSCDDIQNEPSDEVCRHAKQIQEDILNLSCPRCSRVFYDFTGCTAVVCESCQCGFCGICLKDCGSDAHQHVLSCTRNPKRGDYFLSEEQLHEIHRDIRIQKLRNYLRNIKDEEVRKGISKRIRRDLIDLGIPTELTTESSLNLVLSHDER